MRYPGQRLFCKYNDLVKSYKFVSLRWGLSGRRQCSEHVLCQLLSNIWCQVEVLDSKVMILVGGQQSKLFSLSRWVHRDSNQLFRQSVYQKRPISCWFNVSQVSGRKFISIEQKEKKKLTRMPKWVWLSGLLVAIHVYRRQHGFR